MAISAPTLCLHLSHLGPFHSPPRGCTQPGTPLLDLALHLAFTPISLQPRFIALETISAHSQNGRLFVRSCAAKHNKGEQKG